MWFHRRGHLDHGNQVGYCCFDGFEGYLIQSIVELAPQIGLIDRYSLSPVGFHRIRHSSDVGVDDVVVVVGDDH